MHVVLFSQAFVPSLGGVEQNLDHLARGLLAHTPHRVTVATTTPRDGHDDGALPYPVRRVKVAGLVAAFADADVVHIAGPHLAAMAAARACRVPYVVKHHSYGVVCPNGLLLKYPARRACPGHFRRGQWGACWRCQRSEAGAAAAVKRLAAMPWRRALAQGAAVNIGVTRHVARRIELAGATAIHHAHPPVAVRRPPSRPGRERPVRFVFVGRLVAEKGLPVLVDAAARLARVRNDFEVLVVGDGPERDALARRIAAAGPAPVRLWGRVPPAQLDTALPAWDVLVMPSVMEETAGLAAIEQMWRGRAVIAADIGGLAETVGAAGITVPPGDAAALAAAMGALLVAPARIAALGAAAPRRAERAFTIERLAAEHDACYRRARADRVP